MLLFIDFCATPWWLNWLLPFLLGLGLGWAIWSKFKSLWSDSEAKVSSLNSSNSKLEADLTATRNQKADLEGDVALMKGRVREMESEVKDYKSQLSSKGGGKGKNKGGGAAAAGAASLAAGFAAGTTGSGDANAEIEVLKAELAAANVRMEKAEADAKLAVSELSGSANAEMDKLRSQLAEANSRADKAEADAKSAATNSGDTERLEGEISSLKGKLSECESNAASLKAKADKAAADLAAAQSAGSGDGVSALAASGASALAGSDAGGGSSSGMSASGGATRKSNPYAKLKSDNLQIVEGVGPKMESVLHENGVKTWSDLAGKSEADLRAILDKYGDKYRIIDPSSWSAQASKASSGDWDGLISLQKSLDGGRGDTANNETDSKLEKLMMKMGLLKRYKQDDLKAVEGIGPKIEELLHNGGIKTWRALADTEVSKIQGILDAAGSRYKLADPGTWPKQAEMAADGKWEELQEYQDFLQGGK